MSSVKLNAAGRDLRFAVLAILDFSILFLRSSWLTSLWSVQRLARELMSHVMDDELTS